MKSRGGARFESSATRSGVSANAASIPGGKVSRRTARAARAVARSSWTLADEGPRAMTISLDEQIAEVQRRHDVAVFQSGEEWKASSEGWKTETKHLAAILASLRQLRTGTVVLDEIAQRAEAELGYQTKTHIILAFRHIAERAREALREPKA